MFSICEEPLVISGKEALAFAWKGDALWTKTGPSSHPADQWTTFVLPSRDPYPLPNLVEFGQFLCASLTFTQCLHTIIVFVDEKERLVISKRQLQPPRVVYPPKSSTWWRNDGAVTQSPKGIFTLGRTDGSITETVMEITAMLDHETSSIRARYISAVANVYVPHDMAQQMYRVTKKKTPTEVKLQIFIDADAKQVGRKGTHASAITETFSPAMGNGNVFIGFKTSQTTGLAAHLAAPLVPTVEREAIDLQNPSLKVFNSELLFAAGILMRLGLEHSMALIGRRWNDTKQERMALEEKLRKDSLTTKATPSDSSSIDDTHDQQKFSPVSNGKRDWLGFASFMSSNIKRFAGVISSVRAPASDDEILLNPKDPRPLSVEEEEAIVLMCSFCPEQSTPDSLVGSLIAKGFTDCMPSISPPVLTNSGVMRSSESRLPFQGIERYVTKGVIRKVVQQGADKYLKYVAGCIALSLTDLEQILPEKQLSEEDLVIFLKWWIRFCRLNPYATQRGPALKAKVRFVRERPSEGKDHNEKDMSVLPLEIVRYYREERTYPEGLPMPSEVLPQIVQNGVTELELKDKSLASWFSPLPFAMWASHISTHSCLTDGRHIDSEVRLLALTVLSKEHGRHFGVSKSTFETWLRGNLANKRCIPFHFHLPESYATEYPGDLYLSSANISLFEGLGSFKKVSMSLGEAGVSDDFLVALGVRKAIAIDFLFTQLDNLKWSGDPKPLISYLCKASLTRHDLNKLWNAKYLPADGENDAAYAPSELHLPNEELTLFPFVKTLYWPSTDELSETSPEGKFLIKLGCRVDPPLKAVLDQITKEGIEDATRAKILSFASERLKPGGPYQREYSARSTSTSSVSSDFKNMKFLPAIRKNPLTKGAPTKEMQSPMQCYTDLEALHMGFSVLDPNLTNRYGKALGERFLCSERPPADLLIYQLLNTASFAKSKLDRPDEEDGGRPQAVVASFSKIFDYLSTRTKEFDETSRQTLREAPFIPCLRGGTLTWFRPTEIYFQNTNSDMGELTSTLFYVTDYNPFLAVAGVQSEPSLMDILNLVVSSPKVVLEKIRSVEKYLALLRRISLNFSTLKVLSTPNVRDSAFLLAYYSDQKNPPIPSGDKENDAKGGERTFVLAKAKDISIIDDSGLARMFNVLCAPDESDLEILYSKIGSKYISKRVQQKFECHGLPRKETRTTKEVMIKIQERKSLLISPTFTSLPLKPNAEGLLSESNLDVHEVDDLSVLYVLDKASRRRGVTCFATSPRRSKTSVYITLNFDWLDVGAAISKLILEKSDVQGSFFVGSLLEAPLERLRARGLPVDRILKDSNLKMQSVQSPPSPELGSASKLLAEPASGPSKNENESHLNSRMKRETVPEASSSPGDGDGFLDILTQMFPDCDERHIQSLLGNAPTLDSLRQVADTLSDGLYPKRHKRKLNQPQSQASEPPQSPPQSLPSPTSKAPGSNVFTRAFRGIKNHGTGRRLSSLGKLNRQEASGSDQPVPPSQDVARQDRLEQLLHNSVRSSRQIPPGGVAAPEKVISSISDDMSRRADTCETLPAQDIKPFLGNNGTGKTRDGIRVFSSRHDVNSEKYLSANADAVTAFSGLLRSISNVYSLQLHSVAIYHQGNGGVIAFNAGGALHFNLRYFTSLHWSGKELTPASYAYWFTVMAHELAHNFVTPHNKDHGHFTESYIMTYLPRLLQVLS